MAAVGVDGVRDVSMQFGASGPTVTICAIMVYLLIPLMAIVVQPRAARVAEPGPQVVLLVAAGAMVGEFSRRHGQEQSIATFDQLDIANDERVVESQGTERFEAASQVGAQTDADLGELHKQHPLRAVGPRNRELNTTRRCPDE
jgi:hypothetical protein